MVRSEQQARHVDEVRPWTGRHYTIDEFLALPDETPHLEFDNGVVTQKVAAKPTHSSVQFLLTTLFN